MGPIDESLRLAAIVESSDDAIVGKTLDGIIQSWNTGAERIYGYSREEVLGQSMTLLLPSDLPDEEADILSRIRRGERVDHFATVRRRKDGRRIHVSLTISPIRDTSGRIVGASHVARDISERVAFEDVNAQLAAIVESSDDAIISKDLNGIILTWNAAAERVYGYTPEEARGRSMTMLLPAERQEEEAAILDRLKRGERVDHYDAVRVRKDGRLIDVALTISPIRGPDGTIRGASHVARDITERKKFEAQVRQTQKLESLGVLAGGVAHDFNNLLTGIMANASVALDTMGLDQGTRDVLADVVRAAERASGLTRQLLAYAGKGRFVTESVQLSDLVREISTLIQTSVPRKVELRLDLDPDLPVVHADPAQLQQVIMNLVINGAEAIGDRVGTVSVSTRVRQIDGAYLESAIGAPNIKPGAYVVLEVRDNGAGMDAATVGKIFDPFFTTKFTGRGLGLAAVMGIVNGHKGALKVSSVPGVGTTFEVMFPVVAQTVAEPVARPLGPLQGSGTVLVVDDEEAVRSAARNALQHYGYEVWLAEDGRQAVDIVRNRGGLFDVVLLDFTMPEMDGEETLAVLKTIRPDLRVVLSSGFNQVDVVRRFTGAGLAGFIQKPYTAAQLARTVRNAIQTVALTAR